ncbi:MAG: DUF4157 domain-containing protein [Nostoc sp. DedQUE01]|nr:DUF4157 domain-containing protein [Nostoc sp. DedQUE01]
MKERIIQPKKVTTDSFSIPALRQPTRGFGLQSSGASSQAALNKSLGHDISRISLRRPQTKLTVNQPGDIYEQQADAVAQDVVGRLAQLGSLPSIQRQQMPQEEELQMKSLASSIMPLMQRQEIPEEEEEELQMKSLDNSTLQRESAPEEEEDEDEEEEELQMSSMVQRQAKAGMAANADLEASINQARGSGQPMAENIRQPMEQAFGADFSGVKVHTDAQSDELNQSIQARAFTTGQDVFFRQGEYDPESRGGQELLAHELTHVVQQSGGAVQRKVNQRASQLGSSQVIQTFSVKSPSAQENLINEHKNNQKILQKGWDATKVDELVNWCKSENQYNSFIQNLSYENWKVLEQDFDGKDLPNKVLDTWVKYQDANQEIQKLTNFIGYKGSKGTTWSKGTEGYDWSACYIATNQDQAEGYIGEAGNETGIASLWELKLTKELPVLSIRGGFIDQDNIPGDFKALVLKKVFNINVSEKLVPYLGSKGYAYMGPGGDAGQEMAMPWGLVDEYFSKRRIKEYQVANYEIKSTRNL